MGKTKDARETFLPEEPHARAQEGDDADSDGYGEEGLSWEAVLATVQVGQVFSYTDIHPWHPFSLLTWLEYKESWSATRRKSLP